MEFGAKAIEKAEILQSDWRAFASRKSRTLVQEGSQEVGVVSLKPITLKRIKSPQQFTPVLSYLPR
jgi:hypothetical protein